MFLSNGILILGVICYYSQRGARACAILNNGQGTEHNAVINVLPSDEEIQETLESISNAIVQQQALRYKNYIQGIKHSLPKDCEDIYSTGQRITGVYTIYPGESTMGHPVRCDMEHDGGGWTIIQRRVDGSTDFQQTWYNYQRGFGSPDHEYWLGNELINVMTSQARHELRIDMTDSGGNVGFVTYNEFNISDAHDGYRLFVDGFSTSSDLKDRLSDYHNRMKFTTVDNDQDTHNTLNCAKYSNGGWWFYFCTAAFLNGQYGTTDYTGIYWASPSNQLRFVEMKIRKFHVE